MMEGAAAHAVLLFALRRALNVMPTTSPNYGAASEALRCTESCRTLGLESVDRARRLILLRLAADHLRAANVMTNRAAENEALEAARRAMSAALLDCA